MTATDSYCTPKWFADRVGTFDTDPCSNPRSHIRATTKYMLETGHNGLALPWFKRTWLNYPYSNPYPWVQKLNYEWSIGRCSEALVLAKLDCSTKWWRELTEPYGCDVWMLHDRINFDVPPDVLAEMVRVHQEKIRLGKKKPGTLNTSNNFCSVLVHRRGPLQPLNLRDIATKWIRL